MVWVLDVRWWKRRIQLEDVVTPDTVSQILDTCFPPSRDISEDGGPSLASGDAGDFGSSRLTFPKFLEKVQQDSTISDFLLIGTRKR